MFQEWNYFYQLRVQEFINERNLDRRRSCSYERNSNTKSKRLSPVRKRRRSPFSKSPPSLRKRLDNRSPPSRIKNERACVEKRSFKLHSNSPYRRKERTPFLVELERKLKDADQDKNFKKEPTDVPVNHSKEMTQSETPSASQNVNLPFPPPYYQAVGGYPMQYFQLPTVSVDNLPLVPGPGNLPVHITLTGEQIPHDMDGRRIPIGPNGLYLPLDPTGRLFPHIISPGNQAVPVHLSDDGVLRLPNLDPVPYGAGHQPPVNIDGSVIPIGPDSKPLNSYPNLPRKPPLELLQMVDPYNTAHSDWLQNHSLKYEGVMTQGQNNKQTSESNQAAIPPLLSSVPNQNVPQPVPPPSLNQNVPQPVPPPLPNLPASQPLPPPLPSDPAPQPVPPPLPDEKSPQPVPPPTSTQVTPKPVPPPVLNQNAIQLVTPTSNSNLLCVVPNSCEKINKADLLKKYKRGARERCENVLKCIEIQKNLGVNPSKGGVKRSIPIKLSQKRPSKEDSNGSDMILDSGDSSSPVKLKSVPKPIKDSTEDLVIISDDDHDILAIVCDDKTSKVPVTEPEQSEDVIIRKVNQALKSLNERNYTPPAYGRFIISRFSNDIIIPVSPNESPLLKNQVRLPYLIPNYCHVPLKKIPKRVEKTAITFKFLPQKKSTDKTEKSTTPKPHIANNRKSCSAKFPVFTFDFSMQCDFTSSVIQNLSTKVAELEMEIVRLKNVNANLLDGFRNMQNANESKENQLRTALLELQEKADEIQFLKRSLERRK